MSIFWRSIHLPSMELSDVATNGFATGYDDQERWYVRILHSKRQFRELFDEGMRDLLPEDAGIVRRRIVQSWLPKESSVASRQLEGQAASSICRAVYDLGEPPPKVLRVPLDNLSPFGGMVVSQQEGVFDGIAYVGGSLIAPFIEVVYSKRQLRSSFDVFRSMPNARFLDEMDRKIARTSLPEESDRPSFRIGAYAGLHFFVALARVVERDARGKKLDLVRIN